MKKILALMLVFVMALGCFAFAGCSGEKKLIEEGKLTMGTNAEFPPYEYVEGGEIVGIDAEIAAAVAEKLGLELVIEDMKFDSLLTAVENSQVDVVFAGLTVSEERKEAVDFTDTYATGKQVIIVPENSKIASVDDLEGKTIGVQAGTTGEIYCSDDFGTDLVKPYDSGALAVAALVSKQIDCVVIDNEPAKAFVKANAGLKILETEYVAEDYAAAVRKGNTELQEEINNAMKELKEDGTIDAIIAKYIKAE